MAFDDNDFSGRDLTKPNPADFHAPSVSLTLAVSASDVDLAALGFVDGDECRIEKEGGVMRIYRNGVLVE
jgi:hypothetical protein